MQLPLFPTAASTISSSVDWLYFYLVAVSAVMSLLIFGAVFFFAIKYRRKPGDPAPKPMHGSLKVEITWSIVPFLIMLTFFWWGTTIYFAEATPPPNALDLYAVG